MIPAPPRQRDVVLVDGSASLYRAFFALPPLSNAYGTPTNAVLGFTTMLLKLLREEEPEAVGVAFDGPGPTRRHLDFPAYKAQRPDMPDRLVQQIPYVRRLLEAMRIPVLMIPGEEADDILGTVAVQAAAAGRRVLLVTGDKDLLQLVGDRILVRDTVKPNVSGPAEVAERYGVSPERLPDYLALTGDSSDNIPGVPGIGERTARELLQHYGTLEGILAEAPGVRKPRLRETLLGHASQARASLRLTTIRTDLQVPWSVEDLCRHEPDLGALLALFRELGFSRLEQQFAQPSLGGSPSRLPD